MDRNSASRVSMNCTTLAAHQLARREQCLPLSGLWGWKGEASSRRQDKYEPVFDLPSDPCQLRAPCL